MTLLKLGETKHQICDTRVSGIALVTNLSCELSIVALVTITQS